MSDTAAAMQELALLDQKRQQLGLSAEEDARYAQLLAYVGQAPDAGGWDSGFGPAWNGGDGSSPENWNADPNAQGFDPASQQWGEPAQQWDPNAQQQWDPNAQQQWDPNAQQQWDPNAQSYDPNAQQWDPNAQAYDPNAQQWDPNPQQQWDPNAQAYDPNAQQWNPNAQAYDPNAQQWDPNAQQRWDSNAQSYDPNAQQWDPNAQAYDPSAQQWDPNAQAYDPQAAQQWDPNAQAYDPQAAQQWDPNAQAYAPDAQQQWDPNAQAYDPQAQQQWDPNAQAYDPSAPQWAPDALAQAPNDSQWQQLAAAAPAQGLSFDAPDTSAPAGRPEDSLPVWPGYEQQPDPSHAWLSDGAEQAKSPWTQPSAVPVEPAPGALVPQPLVPDGSASLSLANEVDLPGLEKTPEWMNPSPVPTDALGVGSDDASADPLELAGFGDETSSPEGFENLGISPLSAPISTPLPDQADLLDRAVAASVAPAAAQVVANTDADDISDADIMEVSDDDVSFVEEGEAVAAPVEAAPPAPEPAPVPAPAPSARPVRIGGAFKPGGAAAVDALTSTLRQSTPAPAFADLTSPRFGGAIASTAPSTPGAPSPRDLPKPSTQLPSAQQASSSPSSWSPIGDQAEVLDAGDLAFEEPSSELVLPDSQAIETGVPPSPFASRHDPSVTIDSSADAFAIAADASVSSGFADSAPSIAFETGDVVSNDAPVPQTTDVEVDLAPTFEPEAAADLAAASSMGAEDPAAFSGEIEIEFDAPEAVPEMGAQAATDFSAADDRALDANDNALDLAQGAPLLELGAQNVHVDDAIALTEPSTAIELDVSDASELDPAGAFPVELSEQALLPAASDVQAAAGDVEIVHEASSEFELAPVELEEEGASGIAAAEVGPFEVAPEVAAPEPSTFVLSVSTSIDSNAATFAADGSVPATHGDAAVLADPVLIDDWSAAADAQTRTPAIDAFVSAVNVSSPAHEVVELVHHEDAAAEVPPPSIALSTNAHAEVETPAHQDVAATFELQAHDAIELSAEAPAEAALPSEMFEPLVPEAIVPEEQLAYAPQPIEGEIELSEDPLVLESTAHPTEIELQEISLGDGVTGEIAELAEARYPDRRVIDDLDLSGDAEAVVPLAPASDFITGDASGRQPEITLEAASGPEVVIASSSLAELANAPGQAPAATEEIELELEGLAPGQPLTGEIELPHQATPTTPAPVTGEIELGAEDDELEAFEEIELTGPLASPIRRIEPAPLAEMVSDAQPDGETLVAIELNADDVDASETIELGAADMAIDESPAADVEIDESPAASESPATAQSPAVPLPFLGQVDEVAEPVLSDSVEIEFEDLAAPPAPSAPIAAPASPVPPQAPSHTPRAEVTRFTDERSTPSRGTPIPLPHAAVSTPHPAPVEEEELELELDEAAVEEEELELELGDVEVEPPEIELQAQEFELDPAPAPAPAAIPLPRSSESPPVVLASAAPGFVPRAPTPAATPRVPPAAPPELDFSLAAPSPSSYVVGEHRVILHTSEGHVKRGIVRDVDLLSAEIPLFSQPGQPPEAIAQDRVKAIFFMLSAGEPQPAPEGAKIRITFNDGRQVAGYASGHRSSAGGFFVVPADNRTNTARIFVYRPSVQAVFEG